MSDIKDKIAAARRAPRTVLTAPAAVDAEPTVEFRPDVPERGRLGPSVAQERAAALAAANALCLQEAQDHLRPHVVACRQHLPTADRLAREAEHPVAAARQDSQDGAPYLTQDEREKFTERIDFAERIIQAPKDGRRGLELFDQLSADQCRREEWQRNMNPASPVAWPGHVHTVQKFLLGGASITEETAHHYLKMLQNVHTRMQGLVRGRLLQLAQQAAGKE